MNVVGFVCRRFQDEPRYQYEEGYDEKEIIDDVIGIGCICISMLRGQ